ncbi:hypothetical protein H9I45_05540 [Polaribacter haliotis]|uniref:Outer membrane protein beta-barrel domain-containing protein n=1 Tax=Polaribacter haliotis TaxID=1888915 RepID=A0A7L8AIW7_9FLAO|nr:hypothetical protein [Polaribacter haliotis]QOD61904.1 hypothetical protein H9I45_05540 [Polaribacter haliotis]
MKKLVFIILFTLLSFSKTTAQNDFAIALYANIGLTLRGDHHGHPAGTLDIVTRFKYNANQNKLGHWVYFAEFEFAQLEGNYKRYSGNLAYNFNRIVFPKIWFIPRFELKHLELQPSIGYGVITRFDLVKPSLGFSLEVGYRLNKHFKIDVLFQASERSDMIALYGDSDSKLGLFDTRQSVFGGLGVEIDF